MVVTYPASIARCSKQFNSTIRTSRCLTALLYRFIETFIMTLWKMRRSMNIVPWCTN